MKDIYKKPTCKVILFDDESQLLANSLDGAGILDGTTNRFNARRRSFYWDDEEEDW